MPSVSIVYGLCEGPRVAQRFQTALRKAGYSVIHDPAQADIIVTHSAGYLLLPAKIRAQKIMHIAPYYWPGKSWFRCMGRKLYDDIRTHHKEGELAFWARRFLWNGVYLWRVPHNLRMAKGLRSDARWQCTGHTIVVRPRFDSFCTPDPSLLAFKPEAAFVSMSNYHDDCWRDPHPYILLIKAGKI
jgi:hypothetical protein